MNPIAGANVCYSTTEEAEVEDRGGFGKVYVFHRGSDDLAAVLLWGRGAQISLPGGIKPAQEAIDRGIRALAETGFPHGLPKVERPQENVSFS